MTSCSQLNDKWLVAVTNPGSVAIHRHSRKRGCWQSATIQSPQRTDWVRRRLHGLQKRVRLWLRGHFVEPQGWRSQDLEYWWQLPGDATRTRSRWLQLLVDLVALTTCSEWHERIAECRIEMYDGLRPSVAQAVAVSVIIATLWGLGTPISLWLLIIPAAIQIPLKTHRRHAHSSAQERRWLTRQTMSGLAWTTVGDWRTTSGA